MLKAPMPYFGGKSAVADLVWRALGEPANYVEPFAGSLAVLLARPGGAGKVETINDADGLLCNMWRAMQHDPEAVAEAADWPVNEADLHARHAWLVGHRQDITARLMGDPAWYDPVAAGWWVWGACAWIGSGWCSGQGPWTVVDGELVRREPGAVKRKMPHVGDAGRGINRKMPHVGDAGQGINRQMPSLGGGSGTTPGVGRGINSKVREGVPHRGQFISSWFNDLAVRLRNVRVACGDFERVLGPSVTHRHGLTGVFLDPPYDAGNHDPYASSGAGVAQRALEWCVLNGNRPDLRVVLAGYAGEHDALALLGWQSVAWKARGGYGSQGEGAGRENAARERLWLSPACLPVNEEAAA